MIGSFRRLAGTVSAAFACSALAATALPVSAHAAFISLHACDNSRLSQPFTPWADFDYYMLAPGGDFEGTLSGWTLSGGAGQGAGSEPYGVTGSVGSSSLSLPGGSDAVSPATCVNAAYPTFRFFVRSDTPGTLVTESVIYTSPLGPVTIPVGTVPATRDWQPTPPMLTGSAIPGALHGGTASVQLQFTASGGPAQVDDVEVDPWGRG